MIEWLLEENEVDGVRNADHLFSFYQSNQFKRMKFFLYRKKQWALHQVARKMIGMKQSKSGEKKAMQRKKQQM